LEERENRKIIHIIGIRCRAGTAIAGAKRGAMVNVIMMMFR
jgi:hypothetical protein